METCVEPTLPHISSPQDAPLKTPLKKAVNAWGSCQYQNALDTFLTLEALKKEHGTQGAFEMSGIKVKYLAINKKPGLASCLSDAIKDHESDRAEYEAFLQYLNSGKYPFAVPRAWFDSQTAEEKLRYVRNSIKFFEDNEILYSKLLNEGFENIDQIFHLMCSRAYHLQEVAKEIATEVFIGLETPGLTRSYLDETGFYCWLLWDSGLITAKDHASVFGGFDT